MERSSFFNAVISQDGKADRTYLAEDFVRYFNSFIGNGVFPNPSAGLQIVAIDNSMDIKIRAGKAWINGYFYENTDDYTIKVDVADGVLSRVDRVVIRLDFVSREMKAYVKKGAYSNTPIAPGLTRNADMYELGIADIRINKGIIKIIQADITDLRFNTSLCGIVKGVVDQIDTTNLFAQYQNEFDIWFKNVQTQLGEDVAGSLQNQITQNKIATDKKIDDIKITTDRTIADNKADVEDFKNTKGKPGGLATLDSTGALLYPISSINITPVTFNGLSDIYIDDSMWQPDKFEKSTEVNIDISTYHSIEIEIKTYAAIKANYQFDTSYLNVYINGSILHSQSIKGSTMKDGVYGVEEQHAPINKYKGVVLSTPLRTLGDYYRAVGKVEDNTGITQGKNIIKLELKLAMGNNSNPKGRIAIKIRGVKK